MGAKQQNKAPKAALTKLTALEEKQRGIWLRMLRADGGALYPLDLFAIGALNRSAALCAGFHSLIEQRNFICAASLLRLQLDTALRFYAAFLVNDPNEFASAVLKGKQIDKLQDKSGVRMRDAHLVSCLSKEYPWVTRVYETTCGYVHLSESHIFQTIESVDSSKREARFKMSPLDKPVGEETYVEAIEAFCAATQLFHRYVEGWIYTKDNPDLVAKLRTPSRTKKGGV